MVKLKEMRKAKGMTQAELAKAVRYADPTVDQATISVLERGELYPAQKLLDAICDALGCTEADLYDGVEAMFVPANNVREPSDTTAILRDLFDTHDGRILRTTLRRMLSEQMGRDISDRKMRDYIETAGQEGLIIGNDQDGMGYYIPETRAEFERIYRQNQNRAVSILRKQRYIRQRIREAEA